MSLKLDHVSGYVACTARSIYHYSFWGCGSYAPLKKYLNVVVTTSSNRVISPPSQFFTHKDGGKWYELLGYNSHSPAIVLPFFSSYWVRRGQQFRLWYGEDLVSYYEGDNAGKVCCNVYALYV